MAASSATNVLAKGKSVPKKKKTKVKLFKKKSNRFLVEQNERIKKLQELYAAIDSSKVKEFKDFPLSPETQRGLNENGFLTPTEIQRESIGLALNGRDILGAAKTGSGKTLAFLIPMLEHLYRRQWTSMDGLGALIITPVRELAYQIFEMLRKIGAYHDFSVGLIIGGKDLKHETKRMDQCNIMICTPGRLLHHMDENPLFNCTSMEILVLDEADQCLDMGFEATMNNIIENLPPERQTLLFSATQTRSVRDLARLSLRDPAYVSVHEHSAHSTPETLEQSYVVCALEEKVSVLWSFLKNHRSQKILVFMASCKQVKFLFEMFCRLRPGTTLLALYGTLHQLRRMSIYNSFCSKSRVVLFATDIAARGLDFPSVDWVVQLDCPVDATMYIHRVGRTARYTRSGQALLVLLPGEEEGMLAELRARRIPVSQIRINPNRLVNPVRKMEAFLARDPNLKASAQRAFVSYAKSVFLMGNKQVFNVHALNTDAYAKSLGLVVPPRIRFLQSLEKQKQQQQQRKHSSAAERAVAGDESESSGEQIAEAPDVKKKALEDGDLFTAAADSDSDADVLCVKRTDHELEEAVDSAEPEPPATGKKKAKPLTKVAVAKKILRKKILPNRRIEFNEEGKAVARQGKEKASQLAREYELEEASGIDVARAKEVLQEEDKFDKQLFREKVKERHRAQRLKAKALKKGGKREAEEEAEEDDGDSGSDGGPDLSWLPDPDKLYGDQHEVSSQEESSGKIPTKRKSSVSKNQRPKKKLKEDINRKETNSFADQEELALQLLKYS
ncbi:probable ATP-dependent RNA helicase DDX10 [Bacillus rossius redtenbacheri]|uniref:probable ATP-dependent RNA helicase DDX10 n=1 Tax=Bacillus rossius redtenbacheri TaxID=93214 RepID=UPI002FDEC48A